MKTGVFPCFVTLGDPLSTPERIRTSDLRFRKPLLYPLSYRRIGKPAMLARFANDHENGRRVPHSQFTLAIHGCSSSAG